MSRHFRTRVRGTQALIALVTVAALSVASTAGAQLSPRFVNGALVARKMEAHYNAAAYKASLAKIGGRVAQRILCAHDPVLREVECTGKLRVKGVTVSAEWTLEKRTARRAKLHWTFTGKGVFQADGEIVAPRAFGLTRF